MDRRSPRVELIAEVATNHGGKLPLALAFIDRFAEAGADWIKFQFTRVAHLRRDDPQYAWFQQAEFSNDQFAQLKAHCDERGVGFLATVFNPSDVADYAAIQPAIVKVGSGEAGERPLARAIVAHGFDRVVVSAGLVPLAKMALIQNVGRATVQVLKCQTRYPCPASLAQDPYSLYTGWSDHVIGLEGIQIALANGARIIEKHVCRHDQARPIQPWEADVEQFRIMRRLADEDPARFLGRWQAA